jgi:hypothetical protein
VSRFELKRKARKGLRGISGNMLRPQRTQRRRMSFFAILAPVASIRILKRGLCVLRGKKSGGICNSMKLRHYQTRLCLSAPNKRASVAAPYYARFQSRGRELALNNISQSSTEETKRGTQRTASSLWNSVFSPCHSV